MSTAPCEPLPLPTVSRWVRPCRRILRRLLPRRGDLRFRIAIVRSHPSSSCLSEGGRTGDVRAEDYPGWPAQSWRGINHGPIMSATASSSNPTRITASTSTRHDHTRVTVSDTAGLLSIRPLRLRLRLAETGDGAVEAGELQTTKYVRL